MAHEERGSSHPRDRNAKNAKDTKKGFAQSSRIDSRTPQDGFGTRWTPSRSKIALRLTIKPKDKLASSLGGDEVHNSVKFVVPASAGPIIAA
jgi:hypothetical protein